MKTCRAVFSHTRLLSLPDRVKCRIRNSITSAMKIHIYKVFLLYFLLLCSFIAHTQNKAIDSIKKILQTQIESTDNKNTKKDTVRIKTLFELACLYFIDN